MKKILIDCFSEDTSFSTIIDGVFYHLNKYNDQYKYVFLGNANEILNYLNSIGFPASNYEIINCLDTILNKDAPSVVVKQKEDSSIVKGMKILRNDKDTIGLISSGSTGGLLVSVVFKLGLKRGIRFPALAVILKSFNGKEFCLLDAGANLSINEKILYAFALLGSDFMKSKGVSYPRVGLLNVGKEENKGSDMLKNAYQILKKSKLNFVGNIEGFDIFKDFADVIVCDGYAGNLILKNSESVALIVKELIKSSLNNEGNNSVIDNTINPLFNYSNYGGAIILGGSKPIIKIHGKSFIRTLSSSIDQLIDIDSKKN